MKRTKHRIAILGSTSHIAKGLISNFLSANSSHLYLFTKSLERVSDFLDLIGRGTDQNYSIVEGYETFAQHGYDVIINCIGVGTKDKLKGNYSNWFTVTETYDNLVISYLSEIPPEALYISLSSGAVYGRDCSSPKEEDSINCIPVNHVSYQDYYAITRINAEAKHRAFSNLNIVDLRVFSYFSRFADLSESYFINELLTCILDGKVFTTSEQNMIRDFIHPNDLFALIRKCIGIRKMNRAFDVTSSRPVEKEEILRYFSSAYDLKYKTVPNLENSSATGHKSIYYSTYNNTKSINFTPEFSALDTIAMEAESILS